MLDTDNSGRLGYEELHEAIRGPYPCLCVKSKDFPSAWIRGLWKAVDVDRSGDVTVDEFVGFMRRRRRAGGRVDAATAGTSRRRRPPRHGASGETATRRSPQVATRPRSRGPRSASGRCCPSIDN